MGSVYHSDLGSNSPEQDKISVTSLPKVINVHEIDSTPKTPVMLDFDVEESGSLRCKNCNTNMQIEDKHCNNCGSLSDKNQENYIREKDEKDRRSLSMDYTYESPIEIKSNKFPKIKVQNEEGISIYSNNAYTEDWTIAPGIMKFDNNVNEGFTAPPVRNVADGGRDTFIPKNEFSNAKILEQNDFGDDKSLCSSFSENVKLKVFKVY